VAGLGNLRRLNVIISDTAAQPVWTRTAWLETWSRKFIPSTRRCMAPPVIKEHQMILEKPSFYLLQQRRNYATCILSVCQSVCRCVNRKSKIRTFELYAWNFLWRQLMDKTDSKDPRDLSVGPGRMFLLPDTYAHSHVEVQPINLSLIITAITGRKV